MVMNKLEEKISTVNEEEREEETGDENGEREDGGGGDVEVERERKE